MFLVINETNQQHCFPFSKSIGCGIGYGYLHRIPVPDTTKPLKPPIIAPTTAGVGGFSEVCQYFTGRIFMISETTQSKIDVTKCKSTS